MQLALILAASVLNPPQQSDFFPFVIPWDDSVRGTATDVSFLNAKPAGKNGQIISRNGVLVEAKTGRRIKFLGTNFTARGAFPDHQDADKVAARLAKLGINIVRFHHLQNSWDPEKGMIWKRGQEMKELDPKQLDRLDYLIAALKKQGIYSNINLQTTRNYLPEMGFPASVTELGFAKRVDKYNRRMIELQKEYAKQLLGRKNKYTGLTLAQDPAVAVVEINNENSLVGAPWETVGADVNSFPAPFKEDLRVLWNRWLARKYASNQALERAWSVSKTPRGANMLTSQRWAFEDQSGGSTKSSGAVTASGASFKAEIGENKGADWGIQANIPGLTLKNGDTYTVKFRGRASKPRQVLAHAGLDKADWHNVGLTWRIDLTPEWKEYQTTFSVAGAEPAHTRIGFFLGGTPAEIEVENLTLSPGADPFKLAAGDTLAQGNLPLPGTGGEAQALDWIDFLTETETKYAKEMRTYLRKDLGVKSMLIDTQISWGGLTGLVREADMELADNHAYYHHPEFPGAGWDEVNWTVRNSPMVSDMRPGHFAELGGLAQYRVAGKPYSISEYNHPAPSDFQVEMMPLLSSFAAVQDWDMIYSFDYGSYGKGEPNTRIQGFFPVSSNPAKAAFFPASAMMFRASAIPAVGRHISLILPSKPYATTRTAYSAWTSAGGVPDVSIHEIGITKGDVPKPTKLIWTGQRGQTWPAVSLRNNPRGNVYVADSPSAKIASGFVGGAKLVMNDTALTFGKFGNNFAALTLTTNDGKPVASSKRMLLTIVGRVENQNMGWNKDRTSVGRAWGNGPTMAEFVPATIVIKTNLRNVWALDGNGRRKSKVKATYSGGKLTFSTSRAARTVWYELG